ncbi:Cof-type HAD-IIB family hydrolase [Salinimicrobium soli]|uniref:Cof-type HAD-IIB family hydrolase n=1 Tax=Salinimicrobium soli TaxID=1254399 RepID=UPI003AAD9EAF
MEYKIVFSDIDGTLLNKERELSPLTLEVIQKLQKEIPVVLISSRMPAAMRHLQEQLHIGHQPLICYNGGLIIADDEIISSTEIPLPILQEIELANRQVDCHVSLYHSDDWYAPEYDQWAQREENNTKVTPTVLSNREVLEKWKKESKGAHKVMCMGEAEKIDRISDHLFHNFGKQLHLYRSKDTYLEVANKEVSKLTAIKILLDRHFHLSLKEAVAFGDNYNDYEMLKAVGMGVAVGNAKPEILEIAREVTHHGKEDGVAKSIRKLFGMG